MKLAFVLALLSVSCSAFVAPRSSTRSHLLVKEPVMSPALAAYDDAVTSAISLADPWPPGVSFSVGEVRCVVVLDVNRDGSFVREPHIGDKGTLHSELDRECIRAAGAAKLPPVPDGLDAPLHMRHVIVFRASAKLHPDAGPAQ